MYDDHSRFKYTLIITFASSANNSISTQSSHTDCKSLIYIMNNSGPKIVLCGIHSVLVVVWWVGLMLYIVLLQI